MQVNPNESKEKSLLFLGFIGGLGLSMGYGRSK
jgi:hypothetical protein